MSSDASAPAPARCTVVLAVKALDDAKSRLGPLLPTSVARRGLVTAMLADTLAAVAAVGAAGTVVVSPDPTVHAVAARAGARAVDEPALARRPAGSSSLNAALRHGARTAPGPVAYLQADLPALRPTSLAAALTAALDVLDGGAPAAFVADRSGEGTVLLVAPTAFVPLFGPQSARAHRDAGAVELDPTRTGWADLRTDIDTPTDFEIARDLGFGAETAAHTPM